MSDVSMEQRLRLVRQVRSKYNADQHDLSDREMILYGRSSRPVESFPEGESDVVPPDGQVSFFRVRVLFAILLLGAVILMDSNGMEMAGITADKVFQAISADYEDVIDTWAQSMGADEPSGTASPALTDAG